MEDILNQLKGNSSPFFTLYIYTYISIHLIPHRWLRIHSIKSMIFLDFFNHVIDLFRVDCGNLEM